MNFQEIFQKDGYYVATNTTDGIVFQVNDGYLEVWDYDSYQTLPTPFPIRVSSEWFNKKFVRITTIKQAFGEDKQQLLNA